MATEDNGDMGFHGKVAEMAMSSVSMFKSPNGPNPNSNPNHFFGSGWDPLISMSQSENFGGSSSIPRNDYPIGGFSHLVHYQSDSGLSEMVPKIPCFGASGGFSEMVSTFGLSDCGQITNNQCPQSYPDNAMKIGTNSEEVGKKKRRASDKNVEGDEPKDNSDESSEQEEKKQRIGQKQSGKQIKDNADNGEAPPKENYIHVRAKRGQATNSHSLAERVRRERISERMRLLQELVPGCNKITGKAVMLDEIINYVQSLQQQVEFLSMKLATVNPEVNIDMERILSKDVIHSNASILGFNNSPHPHPYSHSHTTTTQPFNPLTQIVWDNELQTLLQMGFDANPNVDNMGPNGRPKPDL